MARTYTVRAINVGSFDLGEADRVLTVFTAERGILKAVAKGSRKPGARMSGRSDVLSVNELLLAPGRSFEIITQAQTIDNYPKLRSNLESLSYGLYMAELTASFGQGLEDLAGEYFHFLRASLGRLCELQVNQLDLLLEFEFGLLNYLGYKPELTFCVACREALDEMRLSRFNFELGGIICTHCFSKNRRLAVQESSQTEMQKEQRELVQGVLLTPLVWKTLVLRSSRALEQNQSAAYNPVSSSNLAQVNQAVQRIVQSYIEQRAGKRFKSLDLLAQLQPGGSAS